MSRELHLNLFINGRGHPRDGLAPSRLDEESLERSCLLSRLALAAEAAKLDSIFFADQLALGEELPMPRAASSSR